VCCPGVLQWHAKHIREFVRSILKATRDGLVPSHIRYFLANITIPQTSVTSHTDLNRFCALSPDWLRGTVIRACDVTTSVLLQDAQQIAMQHH
jgi:hypothetical protein